MHSQGLITLAAMKVVSAVFQFCAYCGEPVFQAVTVRDARVTQLGLRPQNAVCTGIALWVG